MRKWISKWWKKLCVGLAASAKLDKTIKVAAASVLIATSAQAGGGSFDENNTGGYYYNGYKPWSVWASFWTGVKETWWFSTGSISKAFDRSSDPAQGYWNSGPVQSDHGPGGNGSTRVSFEPEQVKEKNSNAVALGKLGGKARSKSLSPERRHEIAVAAGKASGAKRKEEANK